MIKYIIWPHLNNCKLVAKIFVCGFNEIVHNRDTEPTCVTELQNHPIKLNLKFEATITVPTS